MLGGLRRAMVVEKVVVSKQVQFIVIEPREFIVVEPPALRVPEVETAAPTSQEEQCSLLLGALQLALQLEGGPQIGKDTSYAEELVALLATSSRTHNCWASLSPPDTAQGKKAPGRAVQERQKLQRECNGK